jgi:hypothetical protein
MRPIDAAQTHTREELKRLDREVNKIRRLVSNTRAQNLSGVGGVRSGTPGERGIAAEHFPEIFIQVDVPNTKVTVYASIPTNTALTDFDWMVMGFYTLT